MKIAFITNTSECVSHDFQSTNPMIILKVYSVQMCESLIAKSGSVQFKLAYYAFFTDFHIVLNKYTTPTKLYYFKKGQLLKRAGQSG